MILIICETCVEHPASVERKSRRRKKINGGRWQAKCSFWEPFSFISITSAKSLPFRTPWIRWHAAGWQTTEGKTNEKLLMARRRTNNEKKRKKKLCAHLGVVERTIFVRVNANCVSGATKSLNLFANVDGHWSLTTQNWFNCTCTMRSAQYKIQKIVNLCKIYCL